MISGVILDSREKESESLCRKLKDLTARYTDERIDLHRISESGGLQNVLEEGRQLDIAVVDVTVPGGLDGARQIRESFPGAEMLVIADVNVSPMEYMQPSIRASALLLRPAGKMWQNVIRDFWSLVHAKRKKTNTDKILWEETREGTLRLPFSDICYLEAREKKVYIRTRIEEFGVNETLESMSGRLPENFVRCHRSFLVNTDYLTKISLGEKTLYLRGGMQVPVSRSYREAFKRHSDE